MLRWLDHGVDNADGPIFLQALLVSLVVVVLGIIVTVWVRRRERARWGP